MLARDGWRRGGVTLDGLAAVLTWAVATPVALLLVHRLDLDPFSVAGVVMPVAVGAVGAAVILALLLRRQSDLLIGVAAGGYAAWIGLTLSTALHGTPFGYGQMLGDSGRLVAQATKNMSTWSSADAFVQGLPTEYPPLYPWSVGHIANLVNRPAWTLFGEMQIVVMTVTIVLGYLLWRRLCIAPVAFAIVGIAPAIFSEPSKDYEFIALVVFVPWILATFAGLTRDRGGMHWLPAGIIGGLLVLTYQGFLLYAAAGLLVLLVLTWRASAARGRYLLHLLGVAVTAFVVSSWYVVPFVWTLLTDGGQRVSDLWESSAIVDRPMVLPFLEPTVLGVIQLVGLLGMVWYRRSTWWAQPLLLLLLGTYAYRVLFLLRTVYDNHNGYLQYTERPIAMILVSAGVLTAAEAAPGIARRVAAGPGRPGRAVVVVAVAVLVAWSGLQGWQGWVPAPRGLRDAVSGVGEPNQATLAHTEHLPGGGRTRFAPPGKGQRVFPTNDVTKVIRTELGKDAEPIVLSYDQRLFTFEPFFAYVAPNRLSANTLQRWDDRAAEIDKLTRINDPAEFAAASADTAFGGIDVFVLKPVGGQWTWRAASFDPAVFDPAYWYVEQLPDRTVVAVRQG
jgi:hypothetical protein